MIFQKVLKGISGVDDSTADYILTERGIICNWWRKIGTMPIVAVRDKLTERNYYWHVNRYSDIDPTTGRPFSEDTPFISTTAGTFQPNVFWQRNVLYSAYSTALRFATNHLKQSGYIFYCYLMILDKQAIEYRQFAEEARDINVYSQFYRFQWQGEITAKINIPVVQIEKYEMHEINDVRRAIASGTPIRPSRTNLNPYYIPPEEYSNIRNFLP